MSIATPDKSADMDIQKHETTRVDMVTHASMDVAARAPPHR